MQKISEEIIKAIEIIVKNITNKLDFDRTYTGIISSVHSDGYTIKYNGTEIKIKTSAIDLYKINEKVIFCIPCGNKRNAYIVPSIEKICELINE